MTDTPGGEKNPLACTWCIDLSPGVHYSKCPKRLLVTPSPARSMSIEEADAVLTLVRGGWLKLELTL